MQVKGNSSGPTLGYLPKEAFGTHVLPTIPAHLISGFKALGDLSGMISDAMDEIGIAGAIPGSLLRPTDPSARIVGRALTVWNVPRDGDTVVATNSGVSLLADVEAHNLAEPGDILVIQGVDQISNMGGVLASIARRQGEIGAVVDGAVRDVGHSRDIGYPIWSRSVSPITGKWRVRTAAVNVPVTICGILVNPGDIIAADEVGVCVVPLSLAEDVLERCRRIAESEARRKSAIAAGAPIAEVMTRKPLHTGGGL
jgi:4-hydroxy-4-methyl-2-oxoglutarate aldolase